MGTGRGLHCLHRAPVCIIKLVKLYANHMRKILNNLKSVPGKSVLPKLQLSGVFHIVKGKDGLSTYILKISYMYLWYGECKYI